MARPGALEGTASEAAEAQYGILQVTLFETLQSNLNALDFSLLLPEIMTNADELDSQLTHTYG
jgi:hypothetical protein